MKKYQRKSRRIICVDIDFESPTPATNPPFSKHIHVEENETFKHGFVQDDRIVDVKGRTIRVFKWVAGYTKTYTFTYEE